jgi:hypothetical protein
MTSDTAWWVWLLAGMAIGMIPMFGQSRALGLVQAAVVIGAPFYIFSSAGAHYLPFLLFYLGLIIVSSLLFRRKNAREHRERIAAQEARKKRWGAER